MKVSCCWLPDTVVFAGDRTAMGYSSYPQRRNLRSRLLQDTLAAQPIFEQPILGLKEFDDDQLVAMNPTAQDHQQKREGRWHGTHVISLSHASAELLDTT